MRAWLVVMTMMALAGCGVQVTGAPCQDDLQCPNAQRCTPEGRCVEGARTGEHLLESCRTAMETLARRADQCHGGTPESYLRLADTASACASVVASVQAGRQAFVPEQFGACVRRLRDLPCGAMTLDDYCEAATARCRPWRELGQTCFDPDGTAELALCLGSRCAFGAFFQLVCQQYLAPGAACSADGECGPTGACRNKVCVTTWCR